MIFLGIWFAATVVLVWVFGRREWRAHSLPARAYLLASWSLVSIGVIQACVAPVKFRPFDETALWFATAGLAIVLAGALNLLNLGKELSDPMLRRVCLAANVAITVIFVAIATHRGSEMPHDPVSVALMTVGVIVTAFCGAVNLPSFARRPSGP